MLFRSDKWHSITGSVTLDSATYVIKNFNELDLTHTYENLGFMGIKGRKYNVLASSLNPNTISIKSNSLVIQDRNKRVYLAAYVGAGIDTRGNFGGQIGIGINYLLIPLF